MSSVVDFGNDIGYRLSRALRGYLSVTARAVGVGWESCTVDLDEPVSAYIALDWRLARFPGRDVALLWDEVNGWAVAVEEPGGERAIVLAYLGGDRLVPEPASVVALLAAVRADDHSIGQPDPPGLRRSGRHEELLDCFRIAGDALRSNSSPA
ncbi:hypothetical protein SAMN05421504_101925 [Amycolatopsis xylanica]|uniref:DUF6292 domain-containing protein n=1 Tax=Amycolatopsis xylanica TaxID=589385 RepID=A0A1H2ULK2_9PSEU|nr:DUF6292 family protein [Amycolatopsis xylanica]SDW56950.1 hypothetical protein SAMN05421504_101925 [Amycolatopsis xylanica]